MRSCSLNLKILICLSIFLTTTGLSCKKADTDKSPPEQVANKIAVTIDGVDIPQSEIDRIIEPQLKMLAEQSTQLPPNFAAQYEKQLREEVLEKTIRRYLLDQKVKEANIVITDDEVIEEINRIATSQREPMSFEQYKATMEQLGQSFETVKADVRSGLARNKFMETHWAGKINVTEEDARKFYEENPNQFEQPEQVKASHILIKPEYIDPKVDPDADPNEAKAIARTKTESLLKQLKEGADFAELAKNHSTCPSAPQGGDLGFFPRGQMTPAFENVAFELETGQISEIVETQYGYHIIKVTDQKQASTITFDQAKDSIVMYLTQAKQSEIAEEYIETLKTGANIAFPAGKEPVAQTDNS